MVLTDVRMDTYRAWPEPMGPWARTDDAGVGWWDEGRPEGDLRGTVVPFIRLKLKDPGKLCTVKGDTLRPG